MIGVGLQLWMNTFAVGEASSIKSRATFIIVPILPVFLNLIISPTCIDHLQMSIVNIPCLAGGPEDTD